MLFKCLHLLGFFVVYLAISKPLQLGGVTGKRESARLAPRVDLPRMKMDSPELTC